MPIKSFFVTLTLVLAELPLLFRTDSRGAIPFLPVASLFNITSHLVQSKLIRSAGSTPSLFTQLYRITVLDAIHILEVARAR